MTAWIPVEITNDINQNREVYNGLLHRSLIERATARGASETDIISVGNMYTFMIGYLSGDKNDFYIAPASTHYHESFEGGLVVHSLRVYNQIIDLHNLQKFKDVPLSSAVFVALTHDWCKINNYEMYFKNVKNEQGVWVQEPAYKVKKGQVSLGHGAQSLVMVMRFCNTRATILDDAEMAAIRWHMYTYDVTSYDIGDLNTCGELVPLVHMLQFADQLAITEY